MAGSVWFMPWLARLAPEKTGFTKLMKAVQDLRNEFHLLIKKRQATHSQEILNDFLDFYLAEIEKTNDEDSSFYKEVGSELDFEFIFLFTQIIKIFVCLSVQSHRLINKFIRCRIGYYSCHPLLGFSVFTKISSCLCEVEN